MRTLYTLTLFLSSALLFLVQPMVGKIILPEFGGSPAVWTATMVFFQAALLGGYAYAHFSTKKLGARRQAIIHIPLMILAGLTLPFATHISGGAKGSEAPLLGVMAALASMVGAVFFTVSAGAPLLQRWFASTDDPAGADPYFLYSASNVGSMVALFAYPLFFEPRFGLTEQTTIWRNAYIALVALMTIAAIALHRSKHNVEVAESAEEEVKPITSRDRASWTLLGAVPSSLLLGLTAYLTTNIAPIPLLWVVPLGLYLLTFIFAFARRQILTSKILARILPLLVTPLAIAMVLESTSPIIPLALFHLTTFFVAAWMCHARLSETRPNAKHLTEFYLWISIGGVLGGLFNAALAPLIFKTLLEYPLALVVACFLRTPRRPEDNTFIRADAIFPLITGFVTIAIAVAIKLLHMEPSPWRTIIAIGFPAALCFFAVDRPKRYALSMAAMLLAAFGMHVSSDGSVIYTGRSFFGVHRIVTIGNGRFYRLMHGTTTHGMQDRQHPNEPLTYYAHRGPLGHVFKAFSGPTSKKHIGFVGLGVGTTATYGEPGQTMTYFEIDPVVKSIATNPKYFSYVTDSKAKVDIVLGDARLTIANQPDSRFGLIVLDAFSSDAIPVHLLTEEAFRLYLTKLEPHGIIAVHISNHYLKLEPVIKAMADDLHLIARVNEDQELSDDDFAKGYYASMWMVLARDKADFGKLNKDIDFSESTPDIKVRPWKDDFSNVLSVFKPID